MALGTPTAAAAVYSASGGTSITPAYPTGIAAGDVLVLFVGQKPTTANGGTVTTPAGWTLRDSLTAAGGYGTTTGADVGNTNLFVYTKDTVTGSETWTLSVTLGDNNVAWAFIALVPVGNGTVSYGTADGQQTTTPVNPLAIALTNGTSATNFQAGDLALWAFCSPTDVSTPSQFSAPKSVTATGATFGTGVELNEPDSSTGNDISGYSAYVFCTAGSSTANPTASSNITGTLTNVRGPLVLLRIRETAPPTQGLTQSARIDNTNTIYSATVTQSAPVTTLTQSTRINNVNAFYSATVGRGAVNLAPSQYNNTNTIYAATVSRAVWNLAPTRYNNTNTFYSATVVRGAVNLAPIKLANLNVFYSPTVTKGAANLQPSRFNNSNTFYLLHITQDAWVINQHTRLDNSNTFYSPSINRGPVALSPARYSNSSNFYPLTVTNGSYVINQHVRFDNANTFYPLNLEEGLFDLHQTSTFTNQNSFFSPSVSGGSISGFKTVRRRKGLRPAIPIDWEELDKLRSLDAKVSLAAIKQAAILNPISATGEVIIDAAIRLSCFNTQHSVADISARSSWNDPTDDELIAIFELIA